MIIWKSPALEIVFICMIFAQMFGYFILHLAFEFSTENGINIGLLLGSIGIFSSDMVFRKINGLGLFDLSESTLFFLIPTWLVGVVFVLLSISIITA